MTQSVKYKSGGLIGEMANQTVFCMANFGNWSATLIHVSILDEQSKLSDLTKCQTNAKVGQTRPDIMEYSKKSILIVMLIPEKGHIIS